MTDYESTDHAGGEVESCVSGSEEDWSQASIDHDDPAFYKDQQQKGKAYSQYGKQQVLKNLDEIAELKHRRLCQLCWLLLLHFGPELGGAWKFSLRLA